MNTKEGIEALLPVFEWLFRASWQSSILVIAVVLAQWLLRKRLSARWRYSLWLVVVARLLTPFSPESSFSLFNFVWAEPATVITEAWQTEPPPEPPSSVPLPSQQEAAAAISPAPEEKTAPGDTPAVIPVPSPITASRPWEPLHIVVLAWLFGVAGLTLHLAWSMLRIGRRVVNARRIDDKTTLVILANCREQMKVRAEVRLLETEMVKSPALFGVLRPVLLLPPGTERRFSSVELRYIFLHELAHLKRHDLLLNWVLAGLQILHWFNPIVWWGFARMRADRELACDAVAISATREDEAKAYGLTIIKMLETLSRPAALPSLVGIMEDKNQLQRRIWMIAHGRKTMLGAILALGVIASLGITGLTESKPVEQPKIEEKKNLAEALADLAAKEPVMEIQILDAETGRPIKGASILFPYSDGIVRYGGALPILKVEDSGAIRLPRTTAGRHGFAVLHPDYAPIAMVWSEYTKDGTKFSPEIPHRYTVKLEKGMEIGGIVRDESGVPVPGVRVEIKGSIRKGTYEGTYPFYNSLFGGEVPITDAAGRWTCHHFPEDIEFIELSMLSPGHACRRFYSKPAEWPSAAKGAPLPVEDFRKGTAEAIWKKGIDVQGTIRSPDGKPLAGVTLVEADERNHLEPLTVVQTDSDGRFLFPDRDPHQVMLKASAPGYALRPEIVNIRQGMPTVDLVMQPAIPLRLRVVDEKGRPLGGVDVRVDSKLIGWKGTTDAKGRLTWSDAPAEAMVYGFHLKDHGGVVKRLRPAKREQKIVVRKGAEGGLLLTIRAQDEAGQPVESFIVTPSHNPTDKIGKGDNGVLSTEVADSRLGNYPRRLKIEAPGYEAATSEEITYSDMAQDLSVTLLKAAPIEGLVLDPDGMPAAKTRLLFPVGEQRPFFISLRPLGRDRIPATTGFDLQDLSTDSTGRYFLRSPGGNPPVIVISAKGIAETTVSQLRRNPTIQLTAWGRIEGIMTVNARPRPDAMVGIRSFRRDGYWLSFSDPQKVDQEGKFVMEQVPPGTATLVYSTPTREGVRLESHPFAIEVKPGATANIRYAVTGRRVTGRLRPELSPGKIGWQGKISPKLLSSPRQGEKNDAPIYDDYVRRSDYERAYDAWRKSSAMATSLPSTFEVELAEDGSFHIEAVPEGVYNLEIGIPDPETRKARLITRQVIVPAGSPETPVDLGVLEPTD